MWWWAHIILIAVVFLYYQVLVLTEEKYLLSKFNQAYSDYMKRTPRWLGIRIFFKGYRWKPVSSLSAVARIQFPETARTLSAFVILLIAG
jgi:hypothetical protein